MDGRYRIQGRSTLRTEVPGQGIAAVGLLGKTSWASSNDSEAASFNLNSHVHASSTSSTIFAMAIVRRPKVAFTLISDARKASQTNVRRACNGTNTIRHDELHLRPWQWPAYERSDDTEDDYADGPDAGGPAARYRALKLAAKGRV